MILKKKISSCYLTCSQKKLIFFSWFLFLFVCVARREMQRKQKRAIECSKCRVVLPADALQQHLREHADPGKEKCPVCNTYFANLEQHFRTSATHQAKIRNMMPAEVQQAQEEEGSYEYAEDDDAEDENEGSSF